MTFGHAIVFKNVIANENIISIALETSKTNQFRNGVNIIVQNQTDTAVCPVNHLKKYLACRSPFGGPLFCHYRGGGGGGGAIDHIPVFCCTKQGFKWR